VSQRRDWFLYYIDDYDGGDDDEDDNDGYSCSCVLFLVPVIHLYFILVIRSQYYKMDDASKGAIYNTA
jgi:hypothetical protein